MISPTDVIRAKRDGVRLEADAIQSFVAAYVSGAVSDAQMSAFAMAVFFRGMDPDEVWALTEAMLHSGTIMDFSSMSKPRVDKHSTGGVGDKVSICLAPLVACCGAAVPMMSGRALGHTGGTLDKLSAIPGFSSDLTSGAFRNTVEAHGLSFIGQTEEFAAADRRFYALRDVTGTVESIPLITASILSKKLAEGLDALVFDVKVGSGAFMKTMNDAEALAQSLLSAGTRSGCKVRALLTNMDQVLGVACGNALELWEAMDVLKGQGPPDVTELTLQLGAEMLASARVFFDAGQARQALQQAIDDGRGLEKFFEVVRAQGGDVGQLTSRHSMPKSPKEHVLEANRKGFVAAMDVEAIGRATMALGAGRSRIEDPVDITVGLEVFVRPGDAVELGQPLVRVHYREDSGLNAALGLIGKAMTVGDFAPDPKPLILGRLSGDA
jgi:pyrimidine-nucleoside phosphorylase